LDYTRSRTPPLPPPFPPRRSSDLPSPVPELPHVVRMVPQSGTVVEVVPDGEVVVLVEEVVELVEDVLVVGGPVVEVVVNVVVVRSEEHTSELQSRVDLVCRLLLEQ